MPTKHTTLLLILDGWGQAPSEYPADSNAIATAKTPYWDGLRSAWPHTLVANNGKAVGLPQGVMGNSEVGHLNLGAGRVVWQELTRIDNAIEAHGMMECKPIVEAVEKARATGTRLHLMGLVSDGRVHSSDRHCVALLKLAKKLGMPSERVVVDFFLDGRDTPPNSGLGYVRALEETLRTDDLGRIGMVCGRYWSMDRDGRWDRIEKAYRALVRSDSEFRASSGVAAIEEAYRRSETDEFVKPTVIESTPGGTVSPIQSGDQVIFFNFRGDRARQITHALVDERFDKFHRDEGLTVDLTSMTQYESGLNAAVAFPARDLHRTLGETVSSAGLRQLRIAETEKYAHVTYFFSGGREAEFEGEDRILIPSPKVPTYDLQPEMSLPEVAKSLGEAIRSRKYDLIIANFANGDMVGHTGKMDATIEAVQAVDRALAEVIPLVLKTQGSAIVTADHGNAEQMWDFDEDCPHTQHTMTPTPLVLVDESRSGVSLAGSGSLPDVAPTVLQLMGLGQPEEMTGRGLIASQNSADALCSGSVRKAP